MRIVVCIGLLLCLSLFVQAQDDAASTSAYERLLVYDGPGVTFPQQVQPLNPGIPVQIVERNQIGNWLRIQRISSGGEVAQDGWVKSGYLNLQDAFALGSLPASDLPDAIPANVRSQSQAALYAVPIIPKIDLAMRDVFLRGQERGNGADVITKIGDSLSEETKYIGIFGNDPYELGAYDYLEDTLLYYRASTQEPSVAARRGLTTYVVFDPFWADKEVCEGGESPLQCELRLKQPAVAFVLFGPNDVRDMTEDIFRQQMHQLVDELLEAGVIPVLMTFSAHPDETFFWQSINFNLELAALAAETNVPLINLWAATRPLPEFGLDEDLIHLKHNGFDYLKYDTGHEWFYGVSLQNLLVLRTLHEIRLLLDLE